MRSPEKGRARASRPYIFWALGACLIRTSSTSTDGARAMVRGQWCAGNGETVAAKVALERHVEASGLSWSATRVASAPVCTK
jgi:hypothetical protein